MGFFGCIPRFLKAHAGWVLTALGSAGMAGTVILVAKEAPLVETELYEAKIEKNTRSGNDFICYSNMGEGWMTEELTLWEKVKIAVPIYAPAILTGAGSLACFWGSQIFNARKQTALVAAYGALAMQFDQYREAVKAEYGEEADKKAYEVSQAEVRRLKGELEALKKESGPFFYEFATLPGVIFEERPEQISNALMHFNRNCLLKGGNDLAELYSFAGLPESCYDKQEAGQYGWSEYENEVSWGMPYVDFDIRPVRNRYGRMVYVIDPAVPPYNIENDYGWEGRAEDHLYSGYDPAKAEEIAKKIGDAAVIAVSKEHICYAPGIF